MRSLTLVSLLGVALAAVTLAAAAGAEPSPQAGSRADETFAESIDVEVVNLEVTVTDRQGRRVTGLGRDDFELSVEREPTAITHFLAVDDGAAGGSMGSDAAPRAAAQRIFLAVYVDNLNLKPFTRNRALRAVRAWVRDGLPAGTEVMVVTHERSLHVRLPFSSDPRRVGEALLELEPLAGLRVHADADRREMLTLVEEAESPQSVHGRVHQQAESIVSDMRLTISSLKELVETLAGLPGRKVLLHLSDGLPMRPGEDLFHAINHRFPDQGAPLLEVHRYDLTRDLQKLVDAANTHGVTIHALDAEGLRTYSYRDAQELPGGARLDQVHISNLQASLHLLTEETGGLPIVNTNAFETALARVGDDLGHYYSLGFQPAAPESERYHRVKVELRDRPGLLVRHREGYRDRPVSDRMTDRTLAALHYGFQPNPLGIEVAVLGSSPHEDGQHLVEISVSIPIGKLAFLPLGGLHRARARLYVGAKDAEGGLAPIQDLVVPIDIPGEELERARDQHYLYTMSLLMRRGRQVVAVGVHDEVGGTSSVATWSLEVGAPR